MALLTKQFVPSETADAYLTVLRKGIAWGRYAASPRSRLVARWQPGPSLADSVVAGIVAKVEADHGVRVAGVFLNLYEDGGDFCPYHKDKYDKDVYTITLGAARDLLLKPDAGTKAHSVHLESGDLYYMPLKMQEAWRHSIPKRKGANGARISVVLFTDVK